MRLFLKHALDWVCVRRSLKVALVVGTTLALINHYDALLYRTVTTTDVLQIAITYLVPYSVATFGSAMQARHIELQRLKRSGKSSKEEAKER